MFAEWREKSDVVGIVIKTAKLPSFMFRLHFVSCLTKGGKLMM